MNAAKGKSRVRALVSRGAASLRGKIDAASRGSSLQDRVAELERDMQEQRALSLRVAQLTDIVQELLVPISQRDEEGVRRKLEEYAATLS